MRFAGVFLESSCLIELEWHNVCKKGLSKVVRNLLLVVGHFLVKTCLSTLFLL